MKRLIATFMMASMIIINAFCQQYAMPLKFIYKTSWRAGYPIVASLYNNQFFDVLKCYSTNDSTVRPSIALAMLDAVTAINGENTKNVPPDDIANMCSKTDTLVLTVIRKMDGVDEEFKCVIVQKNNRNGYGDFLTGAIKIEPKNKFPEGIRVIAENNIDFAKYNTYDFIIAGSDPLEDKKILEQFCRAGEFSGMRRDETNPDLVVTIAKNVDESVASTYVPPTTQVINNGSITTPQYNYITHKTSWITRQRNSYHSTDGYSMTTRSTSIYLEISVLDAKKMADPNITAAPIIWQMKYTRSVTNRAFELLDEYLAIASWNTYPFTYDCYQEKAICFTGTVFDRDNVAGDIVPGSPASRFLQKGDKIIKVNGKKQIVCKSYHSERVQKCTIYLDKDLTKKIYKLEDQNSIASGLFRMKYAIITMFELDAKPESKFSPPNIYLNKTYENTLGGTNEFTVLRNGKEVKVRGSLLNWGSVDIWNFRSLCKTYKEVY